MPRRNWIVTALTCVACSNEGLIAPTVGIVEGAIVSDARAISANSNAGATWSMVDSGLIYVSLPAGHSPRGAIASVRSRHAGDSVRAAMINGGLDPVALRVAAGDTVETSIENANGDAPDVLLNAVPARRRPRVIRTVPTRRKTDVPLNARISIVFSEPIDRRSLTPSSVRLVSASGAVPGSVSLVDSAGLRAEFVPASPLAAGTAHQLIVSEDVRDLDGDALESVEIVDFSTGAAVAAASIVTQEAALISIGNGAERAFTMQAYVFTDGSVSGSFSLYRTDTQVRLTGRITCVTLLDGTAAWIAGRGETLNDAPDLSPLDWGWRVVDNDGRTGRKDQLSLIHSLEADVLGTPESFCATTPLTHPQTGEIRMHDLVSGNIIATGTLPPPPVPPVSPPEPSVVSQIVYRTGSYGIQLMNSDGSGGRALTAGGGDSHPAWSPDGRQIVFTRGSAPLNNYGSIYVINVDRTGLRRLTTSESDAAPAWSPDGQKIAFERGQIHVMNADGSNLIQLTSGGAAAQPEWSPDGSRIVYASWSGNNQNIWVMNADGTAKFALTSDSMQASAPTWSPDGTRIAFVREVCDYPTCRGLIYVVNVDGTGLRRLTLAGRNPSWSPDGTQIVYEDFGVTAINVDGSGRVKRGNGSLPAWSRHGTTPALPTAFLAIERVGGDAQSDTVFSVLPAPLQVRVVRDDGTPVSGVRIDWLFPGAGADPNPRLNTYVTTTDASGTSAVSLTLGRRAGTHRIRAAIIDGSAHSDVEFTATARAGNPIRMGHMIPDTLIGVVDSTLEFAILATDSHGNYATDVPISWALRVGEGSVSPATAPTALAPPQYGNIPVSRSVLAPGPQEGTRIVSATGTTISGAPRLDFTAIVVTKIVEVTLGVFRPDTVSVPSGRTVAWAWYPSGDSDDVHNVTFEDEPTAPSSSPTNLWGMHRRTFGGAPRTIRYRCTLHSTDFAHGEIGVVIVR